MKAFSYGPMAASVAAALALAGCGSSDIRVTDPKISIITDDTVHITCGLEPRGDSSLSVEYLIGPADAHGMPTAPVSLSASGGFIDIPGLKADTTYAVTFVGHRGVERADVTPTLTFHTLKGMDSKESFLLRAIPGAYRKVGADGQPTGDVVNLRFLQIDANETCKSGIALAGPTDVQGLRCMDFDALHVTGAGGISADWQFGMCDCDALAKLDKADGAKAECEALRSPEPACGAANASGGVYSVSFVGHETDPNGTVTEGRYLKWSEF